MKRVMTVVQENTPANIYPTSFKKEKVIIRKSPTSSQTHDGCDHPVNLTIKVHKIRKSETVNISCALLDRKIPVRDSDVYYGIGEFLKIKKTPSRRQRDTVSDRHH